MCHVLIHVLVSDLGFSLFPPICWASRAQLLDVYCDREAWLDLVFYQNQNRPFQQETKSNTIKHKNVHTFVNGFKLQPDWNQTLFLWDGHKGVRNCFSPSFRFELSNKVAWRRPSCPATCHRPPDNSQSTVSNLWTLDYSWIKGEPVLKEVAFPRGFELICKSDQPKTHWTRSAWLPGLFWLRHMPIGCKTHTNTHTQTHNAKPLCWAHGYCFHSWSVEESDYFAWVRWNDLWLRRWKQCKKSWFQDCYAKWLPGNSHSTSQTGLISKSFTDTRSIQRW